MLKDRLNVIIPIYNPHEGWEDMFIESVTELKSLLSDTELKFILVNDGSTRQLGNIQSITNCIDCIKYISYPDNHGKGYAIRRGIGDSEADYYVYSDIDFPFGHHIIFETYQILRSTKVSIVIGTRDLGYFKLLPFKRRISSYLLKEVNYLITGFKIKDTQAGLKGLDNKAKSVLLETKTNTFIFELEFLKNCLNIGLDYKLIDVSCRPQIKFTNFRIRILMNEIVGFLKIVLS
jgi:hypothetical protein